MINKIDTSSCWENSSQHIKVEWMKVQIVYNGLNVVTKQMQDMTVNCSLSSEQPNEGQTLIKEMTTMVSNGV